MGKFSFKKLKKYHNKMVRLEDDFFVAVERLSEKMRKEVGIEDLEFFILHEGYVGIGNASRTMKLIQREELDKL